VLLGVISWIVIIFPNCQDAMGTSPLSKRILKLAGRPLHRSPTEHMYMQVEDRLAGTGARVDDRAVSALAVTRIIGQARGDAQEMAKQSFVPLRRFVERFHMFERNHEYVRGRLRVDVPNSDAAIILMNKLSGNVTGYDFAKETGVIGHALDLV
jgi:hypothetical protein